MSNTLRKYPTYKNLHRGEFYADKDLPKTKERKYYRQVPIYEIRNERVYYTGRDEYNKYYSYFKMEDVKVATGEYRTETFSHTWYVDHETKYYYNEKSPEGWNHCQRIWHSHSVGNANKRIRAQKHRSKAKDVLKHWTKGDFSRDIERERNQDRWDWL